MAIKKRVSAPVTAVEFKQEHAWSGAKYLILLSVVLVLLAVIAHGASIWNGFCLSDYFQLQPLRGIEPKKWSEFWVQLFTEGFLHPFSAPLTTLSIALDFQSAGMTPALYHAVNLLLQVSGLVSAFLLLSRLTEYFQSGRLASGAAKYPLLLPFLTCAILAVHPIGSDSVAHISGRASLITFLWFTIALHAFLTGFMSSNVVRGVIGYLVAYLSIVVSVFSSCQALLIPLSMIVVGLLLKPANDGGENAYSWKDWLYERAWEFAGLVAMSVGLPFLYLLKSNFPAGDGLGLPALSAAVYFATQFKALAFYYLRIFVAPFALTIAPTYAIATGWFDPGTLPGVVVVIAALALIFKFKRRPFVVFGLFLFFVGLVPQGIAPQAEYASATRFYFSCFGLALVGAEFTASALAKLKADSKLPLPPKALVTLSLVLLTLAGLANWRDRGFSSNSAIVRGALRLAPDDFKSRALLAYLLSTDGGIDLERGNIEAGRALKQDDNLPLAHMAQGDYERWQRMQAECALQYTRALALAESQHLSPEVILAAKAGLALALAEQEPISNPSYLRQLATSALKLYPSRARLYLALGKAILAENKPESAELACRQFDRGRQFDRNDIDFTQPYIKAALATGYPFRFEVAYGAAHTAFRIQPSATIELLWARAALETGRIKKGMALMKLYYSHVNNPTAEAYKVTAGLAKQLGDNKAYEQYTAYAKKADPEIDKHVHLFMIVPPKPSSQDNDADISR